MFFVAGIAYESRFIYDSAAFSGRRPINRSRRGQWCTPVTLLLEIQYEIENGHVRNIKMVNTHQEERGRNGQ